MSAKKRLRRLVKNTEEFISKQKEREQKGRERLDAEQRRIKEELERIEDFMKNAKIGNLIAVHLTDHFPNKGIIHPTSRGFFLKLSYRTRIKGILHDLRVQYPRYTIHFALNHAVASHMGGDWKGRRFAILIPLKDIISQIISLDPADTWVLGDLKLPSSTEILMRETTYYGLEGTNPRLRAKRQKYWDRRKGNATIISYPDNLPIHKAVEKRLREKDYVVTGGGHPNWDLFSSFYNLIEITRLPSELEKEHWRRLSHEGFEKYLVLFRELRKEFGILWGGSQTHSGTGFKFAENLVSRIRHDIEHKQVNFWEILKEIQFVKQELRKEKEEIMRSKGVLLSKETMGALDELERFLDKLEKELNKISAEEIKATGAERLHETGPIV
ncbi:MAG: hypothetical protein KJ574_03295 [Nanoarchaeota archaeon]|nr:hypothetical protein [Nanoarchaeota archaeon]